MTIQLLDCSILLLMQVTYTENLYIYALMHIIIYKKLSGLDLQKATLSYKFVPLQLACNQFSAKLKIIPLVNRRNNGHPCKQTLPVTHLLLLFICKILGWLQETQISFLLA